MKQTIRCIVKGRVQGVFFRATTQSVARKLGLTGHAVNLADGSVEVIAQGEQPGLEQLKHYLVTGPDNARVDSLECETLVDMDIPFEGFRTG